MCRCSDGVFSILVLNSVNKSHVLVFSPKQRERILLVTSVIG